ncbi:MAG TPA: hypothetical protein VF585_09680 [Chthoniobacterales bacterium]|jgi:hypothetical protein
MPERNIFEEIKAYSGSSETRIDLDLNLPEVLPGEALLPLPEPSYEAVMAHARWLLKMGYGQARVARNPEPFVM